MRDTGRARARARDTWTCTSTCTFAILAACSPGEPGPGIDVDRAIGHVAELAKHPRPGDTDAARQATAYIETQLEVIGVTAERFAVGGVDLPAITVLGVTHRTAHHVDTIDPDLVVRFGPPGEAVLVMAHYDTVAASPGAVDNAAAVGVLLELARVLHDHPPAQPVLLAFTANEEIGLVGAEALAERRRGDVAFAIALDLIGGSGELTLNGAGTLIGDAELRWIANAADRAGVPLAAPLAHRVASRWWPQAERSDHGPFTRRGIPAVHFYNRGQDGEWIDLAYHSARDLPARVDRASVADVGRLLRALVELPPPAHAGDGFWVPIANVVVPRGVVVGLEIALAALAAGVLISMALAGRRHARVRGLGLLAGTGCYAIAAATTYAVERAATGDHPARWLHAPATWVIAELLVFGGMFGLATRTAGRFAPWTGSERYRAIAIGVLLASGVACLMVGAAEVAWIWLVPAAIVAIAPRLGPVSVLAIIGAALPMLCVLYPLRLREAAWNGFLPVSIPLAVWVTVFGICIAATGAWWLRPRIWGPLGTLVLTVGCGLAVPSGLALAFGARHDGCSALNFERFGLACEQVAGVR